MITVILAIGFVAVSIAALLQVRAYKKLKRKSRYQKFQIELLEKAFDGLDEEHQQLIDSFTLITAGHKQIIQGVYYYPETDTLVPFEDLEYIGEF